jgi:ATP-dependent DNA ligase
MDFPILYGEASTGKTKVWKIRVISRQGSGQGRIGVIETTHGYEDGKMQINEKEISEGKNIGKKNETSPLQQAINEARSSWQKKKDSGYSPKTVAGTAGAATEEENVEAVEEDAEAFPLKTRAKAVTECVPGPMLAHDFNKRGKSISFPCYVQRKYDGTRCVAIPQQGLYSRNKKRYPHLEHILEDISKLPSTLILDGELYSDDLTFQEIVGLVKRETLKKGDAEKQLKIQYHVYDIISDSPYEDRHSRLQALFDKYKFKYLRLVKTEECANQSEMKKMHAEYVAEGYEGIMLRNKTAGYKIGQRSADLQKYKEFIDEEYEVVDYKDGEGVESGCVIWHLKTPKGQVFACRPRGTREERMDQFIHGHDYVGKMLTVRYQELTDDGVPRFPIGIAFRDYE